MIKVFPPEIGNSKFPVIQGWWLDFYSRIMILILKNAVLGHLDSQ
jgi:hypothetical protein